MVKIEKVKNEERMILEKMLQLYLHDISLYFPMDFNSRTGEYAYDSLDTYFSDDSNFSYFIKIENEIAGFILVDTNNNDNVIQEMFVMNNYKSKGVGEEAVTLVLNKYRGKWIIRSLPNSPKAEKFWNKTVKNYTKDNFNIEHVGKYNRAVFTFSNME